MSLLNICIIVTDSNSDRSVMVLTVEASEKKLGQIKKLASDLAIKYSEGEEEGTDGSMTQEDYIETGLKAAGYKVTWPLGNYTVVEV